MPTASGYITVTGQSVSAKTDWTNPTNVAGAPDASVAIAVSGFQNPETLLFTHGLTLPNGSVASEVRVTLRIKGSALANVSYKVRLAGSESTDTIVDVGGVAIPNGSLQDIVLTETGVAELAACTPNRVNDGNGELDITFDLNTVTIDLDSVLLEIDYTVSRNVAAYCNRKFVKSPLIQLP